MNGGGRRSPEPWYARLILVVAVVAAVFLGYEAFAGRGHRRASIGATSWHFQLAQQIDFSGKSLTERQNDLRAFSSGEAALSSQVLLGSLRGIICLVTSPSDPSAASDETDDATGTSLTYSIEPRLGAPINLYPLSGFKGKFLFLMVSFTTVKALDSPTLFIREGKSEVQRIPLATFKPLAAKPIGPMSADPAVAIHKSNSEPDVSLVRSVMRPNPTPFVPRFRVPQYRVQLLHAAPAGEVARVRLIRTEFGAEPEIGEWHDFKNGEASLFSPIGPLASEAEVELVFCRSRALTQKVTAPLGRIAVEYGQPIFFADRAESIALTPSLMLRLPEQGEKLRRPSGHPKRTILISAALQTASGTDFPDSLTSVRWLSPAPAALGLDAIWFPGGSVYASSPSSGAMKDATLTANLQVSFTRWEVIKRKTMTLLLQAAPSTN